MKNGLVILVMLMAFYAKGQVNLVPNPSFEDYTNCPSFPASGYYELSNWFNPNTNSPDYYNECCTIPLPAGADVPLNKMGFQYARTGFGYASVFSFGPADTHATDQREFIAVELLDSLEAGKTYCVEFFVSLPNGATWAIKDMGLYISDNNPYVPSDYILPYTPQIVSNRILDDTLNWMQVSDYYTAQGGEKFITIGNFTSDALTTYITLPGSPERGPFYFIDDVSVVECDPPVPETSIILPNIFTPNGDGHNDVLVFGNLPELSGLSIYNRWGNIMYQKDNYQNNWKAEDVSDGVYFYILKLPNGESKKGTIQVIR